MSTSGATMDAATAWLVGSGAASSTPSILLLSGAVLEALVVVSPEPSSSVELSSSALVARTAACGARNVFCKSLFVKRTEVWGICASAGANAGATLGS